MPENLPKRRGRKPTPITLAQVESCGRLCMSQSEIGDFFGVDQSTISRRFASDPAFAAAYAKGKANLRKRLRAAQIKAAIDGGNVVAQIWLGKQLLDQRDKSETHDVQDVNVNVTYIAKWGGETPAIAPAPDPDDPDVIDGELDPDPE